MGQVEIEIEFDNKPSDDITDPTHILGGIKIISNGYEITKHADEDNGTFKGEYIVLLVANLVNQVLKYIDGTVDLAKTTESRCEIHGQGAYLIYSWVNEEYLRMAYQSGYKTPKSTTRIPLKSALGIAIRKKAICNELAVIADDVLQFTARCDIQDSELLENLARNRKKLEDYANS